MEIVIIKRNNYFPVETSGDRVRHRDEQEVRHDHHDLHRPQHAYNDVRSLPSKSNVEFRPRQPQHGLHRDLQRRMHPQDLCPPAILFQRTLECL
jgi:hypothetical protein